MAAENNLVESQNQGYPEVGAEVTKRPLHVFFILDTSSSMQGTRIGALNSAVEQSIKKIIEIQESQLNIQIKVSVLSFNTEVEWMYPQPVNVDDMRYIELRATGLTNFAQALEKLEEKLHKSGNGGVMEDNKSSYVPVFILVSDGQPNVEDYRPKLEVLKRNGYFMSGARVAIAIDDESIRGVLEEFTLDPKTVIVTGGEENEIANAIIASCAHSTQVSSSLGVGDEGGGATEETGKRLEDDRIEETLATKRQIDPFPKDLQFM